MKLQLRQEGMVTVICSAPPLYRPNILMTSLYFTTKREALEAMVKYYNEKAQGYKTNVPGKREAQRSADRAVAALAEM